MNWLKLGKRFNKTKYRILSIATILVVSTFWIYHDWVQYLTHHIKNHVSNLRNSQPLSTISTKNTTLSKEHLRKLKIIESVKAYGKKIYRLKKAEVYENYIQLDRETLGKNLIVAQPLKLELKKFYFPFIGDFSYLGFFNFELLDQFKKKYATQGLDVYISKIGAFTYLTYFKDPIFSTYLQFSDYQIITLVLHEMAHIKLYFSDDTNFSESIASFIESHAAQSYMENIQGKRLVLINKKRLNREYNSFNKLIENTKQKLSSIFDSQLSVQEKLALKETAYKRFRILLKKMATNNLYLKHTGLLKLEEINNAVLLQTSRYTPPHETGLDILLKQTCKNDFVCWFKELEKLKECKQEIRYRIIKSSIKIKRLLEKCNR